MRTVRSNQIEFDSSKKIREDDKSIVVPTILTRESILPFKEGKGYRSAKELKDAAWTLEGSWIVSYDHIPTVFVVDRRDIRGKVENVKFSDKINGIIGDIRFQKSFCEQAFLDGVREGSLKDVSVAYFCEDMMQPGKFGDEPYDFVQQNFMFGHVAAGVGEGRCPSPFCGMSIDSLLRPHQDPEVTEDYVRIRVRDPDLFVEGSFRTIVLSADQGIHAIIGKLKSDPQGSTVIQNYMFEVAKDWTMEKAQAWVKDHKDAIGLPGIKTRLRDLETHRREIMEQLYPKTQLSEQDQQRLGAELTVMDAEMKAYVDLLSDKIGQQVGLDDFGDANFPDSCFAYVPESAKGPDGNKSERKLPYKSKDGTVDLPHVRNALARLDQTEGIPAEEKTRIRNMLERILAEHENQDSHIKRDLAMFAETELERARQLLS